MAGAEDRIPGYKWTSEQEAEFKKLSGSFQATAFVHDQEASTAPPAVRRFVRPRAYSPSDRSRPCHVLGPNPPFSAIVASYGRRFGPLPRRAPPVVEAAASTAAAARAIRGSEPYVSGAYAPTTAPDRDFFTRGPSEFPAGHNHYQVSDELRKGWYTPGNLTDQAQKQ
ncbi:hypothetical protein MMC17_005282 [Xylographa soralifera]|nr:hypothetical protein [Xylographa soralifera]